MSWSDRAGGEKGEVEVAAAEVVMELSLAGRQYCQIDALHTVIGTSLAEVSCCFHLEC